MTVCRKFWPVIVLLISTGTAGICQAGDNSDTDPNIDAIERKLELGRHQELLDLIAESGTSMAGFTTDGCSGGLSAGWEYLSGLFPEMAKTHGEQPPWEACCIDHDRQYPSGGRDSTSPIESFEGRKQADLTLFSCVQETGTERSLQLQTEYGLSEEQVATMYRSIAEMMYRAVRMGGMPCTGQPWRWGYGWPQCR